MKMTDDLFAGHIKGDNEYRMQRIGELLAKGITLLKDAEEGQRRAAYENPLSKNSQPNGPQAPRSACVRRCIAP